ncbi:hypothetical protein CEXT_254221 [Caerostris extrusa]|uniref:Uncharacterized protein n=1 Tax=Caerostris extrusa TaxID=172846 RepID=A0AAV4X052_CAEEX|nr:hypothetical protein CEXT_254221 [Caerostris extrusa]
MRNKHKIPKQKQTQAIFIYLRNRCSWIIPDRTNVSRSILLHYNLNEVFPKQPRKSKLERRAALERVVDARNELSPSFQEVCRREWRPLAACHQPPPRDSHSLIAGWGSSPSPGSEVKGVVNEEDAGW